jgi:hypothetical protein
MSVGSNLQDVILPKRKNVLSQSPVPLKYYTMQLGSSAVTFAPVLVLWFRIDVRCGEVILRTEFTNISQTSSTQPISTR